MFTPKNLKWIAGSLVQVQPNGAICRAHSTERIRHRLIFIT